MLIVDEAQDAGDAAANGGGRGGVDENVAQRSTDARSEMPERFGGGAAHGTVAQTPDQGIEMAPVSELGAELGAELASGTATGLLHGGVGVFEQQSQMMARVGCPKLDGLGRQGPALRVGMTGGLGDPGFGNDGVVLDRDQIPQGGLLLRPVDGGFQSYSGRIQKAWIARGAGHFVDFSADFHGRRID